MTNSYIIQATTEGKVVNYFRGTEATVEKGFDPANIRKVLRGVRQHAGGFKWTRANAKHSKILAEKFPTAGIINATKAIKALTV